jgi:hypothetical protein
VADGLGEIAAAGGHVEHTSGLPFPDNFSRETPPPKIESGAQQVVCEVVPAGNRREDRLHLGCFGWNTFHGLGHLEKMAANNEA